MSAHDMFWLLVGLMLGVTVVALPARLLRAAPDAARRRERIAAFAVSALLVGTAVALYLVWGRPDLLGAQPRAPLHAQRAPSAQRAPATVSSLDMAAEKLAARLARQGGTPEEWDLLAQSYDQLGRGAEAEGARARRVIARAPQAQAPAAATETRAAAQALQRAQALRRKRDFAAAASAFEEVIALGGMSADAWADYADVLASRVGGKLAGAPARALDQALGLDPTHTKALWLEASLALEERRYAAALDLWRKLRTLVPDDSADAPIIDGNIAEARELVARAQAGARSARAAATLKPVAIDGLVEIDPSLLSLARGSVLFVFAKSIDSPGPPLAVWRATPASWPVAFRLDDSMAMLPSRRLSDFRTVVIEARLSRSGRAEARPGDLSGPGVRLETTSAAPVRLRIASKTT